MGIYGTVLTRQIDLNVLESLCLKKFSQKSKKTESDIFPLYLTYNVADLQCKICHAKYGKNAHVPDILGGTLRKQKLLIFVKNLL